MSKQVNLECSACENAAVHFVGAIHPITVTGQGMAVSAFMFACEAHLNDVKLEAVKKFDVDAVITVPIREMNAYLKQGKISRIKKRKLENSCGLCGKREAHPESVMGLCLSCYREQSSNLDAMGNCDLDEEYYNPDD